MQAIPGPLLLKKEKKVYPPQQQQQQQLSLCGRGGVQPQAAAAVRFSPAAEGGRRPGPAAQPSRGGTPYRAVRDQVHRAARRPVLPPETDIRFQNAAL